MPGIGVGEEISRRPAVAAGLAIRTGTTRLDGDPRPAGPRHRVPPQRPPGSSRNPAAWLIAFLSCSQTTRVEGRNDVPAPPGERGGQLRSVCGCGAGPGRPIVPVGWPIYRVRAALPPRLTCPKTDTDHSDQGVPVLFAPLFLEGRFIRRLFRGG